MKKYFDVHCEFDGDSTGYSIAVEIDTDKVELDKDDVIKYCLEKNLFTEIGDEDYVDNVTEIDFTEYQIKTK